MRLTRCGICLRMHAGTGWACAKCFATFVKFKDRKPERLPPWRWVFVPAGTFKQARRLVFAYECEPGKTDSAYNKARTHPDYVDFDYIIRIIEEG